MIKRPRDLNTVKSLLDDFPIAAILGPRQCGKTTLANQLEKDHYFDLENPRDLAQLENPQLALESLKGLIVIDEIQRKPDLFPLLRWLVDTVPDQSYLILGSASRELMQQTSESLAGRIAYYRLNGLGLLELGSDQTDTIWMRGGFPKSVLARTNKSSLVWRENYVATFLERDIPMLGIQIPANTLRRFWTMLAHYNGQLINYSEIGRNFGISDMTVRKYLDILQATFMIRIHQPWHVNLRKRMVKRPKLYFKDSGILHSLLSIRTKEDILSHPKLGASWEGFALDTVCRTLNLADESTYFWRTHNGAEIDLFWQSEGKNWGIEFKYADAPKITPSMRTALKDLNIKHLWVVYPGNKPYKLDAQVSVIPLAAMESEWTVSSS